MLFRRSFIKHFCTYYYKHIHFLHRDEIKILKIILLRSSFWVVLTFHFRRLKFYSKQCDNVCTENIFKFPGTSYNPGRDKTATMNFDDKKKKNNDLVYVFRDCAEMIFFCPSFFCFFFFLSQLSEKITDNSDGGRRRPCYESTKYKIGRKHF